MRNTLHWATFLAALAVVVAILLYPSLAQQSVKSLTVKPVAAERLIFPPAEYDHDYDGDLTIRIVDSFQELHALCKYGAQINPSLLGCSQRNEKSCLIIMIRDDVLRRYGWSSGIVFQHERGHCNGWSQDHVGMRPLLIGDRRWVSPDQRTKLPLEWEQEAAMIKAKTP